MPTTTEESRPKREATRIDFLATSIWRPLSRNQDETASTKRAETWKLELVAWVNLLMATGESSTSQKFCISKRALSGLNAMPTGCCIQAFATRIQRAERFEPKATIQVAKRCSFFETRSQPKNITAKNVASRKKAKIPSAARGAPKISPTIQA